MAEHLAFNDGLLRVVRRCVAGLPHETAEFVATWPADLLAEKATQDQWYRAHGAGSEEA